MTWVDGDRDVVYRDDGRGSNRDGDVSRQDDDVGRQG